MKLENLYYDDNGELKVGTLRKKGFKGYLDWFTSPLEGFPTIYVTEREALKKGISKKTIEDAKKTKKKNIGFIKVGWESVPVRLMESYKKKK